VPATDPTTQILEVLVTRLHESHEVSAYDAIERLVKAGEAVGLGADTLVRMLDRGMRLNEILELIEEEMERLQMAAESRLERRNASQRPNCAR
jgi:hypothetical protein